MGHPGGNPSLKRNPKSLTKSGRVDGGKPPQVGEPLLRDPPDLMILWQRSWILNSEQNQQPITERKDRGHLSNSPTVSRVNKDGAQIQRN
jgi:hypothetical protein